RRVYATTDCEKGALRRLADERGYRAFKVPDDIGGRFSVLTAVGLLPCAAAGLDIGAMMSGAREAMDACGARNMDNPAWLYAGARNILYRKGFKVEVLACYEPAFRFMGEWWKQLFGESEGKRGLGIFPASVDLTADLHSMGQYIQEGERFLQETVVAFERGGADICIEGCGDDGDGLEYLAGTALSEINRQASRGTMLAHADGGVPVTEIFAGAMDEQTLGQLVYMFELSCALSGYVLGVNPFDQPGVEAYKKNMFALLGKPGFERLREDLLSRL
ncbi:MAG: glucose-6-phosphate isomerase, partial [Oscillospiraceae bacterium]|nr:glucose-6-phosphate isomerase [Oscillospiraceae bacterium]